MTDGEYKKLIKKKADLRDSAQRHLIKNQFSKALDDMKALYQLDPNDLRIKVKIGDILMRMGRKEEAFREYLEAQSKYAEGGFLVQAIAVLKLILRNDPSRKDVAQRLAELYSRKHISTSIETPRMEIVGMAKGITEMEIVPEDTGHKEERPQKISPLPEVPIFSQLPKDAFMDLMERVEVRRYPEKGLIIKEGDQGDSIWVVTQGKVRIFRYDRKGNRIWLKDLREGDFFGEFGFFSRSRRHASVEAITEVECLEIPRDAMEELIMKWPDIGDILFDYYKKRVMSTFLAFSPIFGVLSPDQRDRFIDRFTRSVYSKDDLVIRQGEEGDTFYMVKSGRLEVFREEDGERKKLAELGPGDFFGEIALLKGEKRTASVRALERAELVCLGKDAFRDILTRYPDVKERIERKAESRMKEIMSIVRASEMDTGLV